MEVSLFDASETSAIVPVTEKGPNKGAGSVGEGHGYDSQMRKHLLDQPKKAMKMQTMEPLKYAQFAFCHENQTFIFLGTPFLDKPEPILQGGSPYVSLS